MTFNNYRLEYWQTETGTWNWHMVSPNNRVVFGSTQGYVKRSVMRDLLSGWFPDIVPEEVDGPESVFA